MQTKPEPAQRHYYVTDFDRIEGGLFGSRPEAEAKARELASRFPGNTIHVLETQSAWVRPLGDGQVFDVTPRRYRSGA
jgi:hypothetical protein